MSLRKYSRYEVCFNAEFVDQSFKFVLDTEAESALAERNREIDRLRGALEAVQKICDIHLGHAFDKPNAPDRICEISSIVDKVLGDGR